MARKVINEYEQGYAEGFKDGSNVTHIEWIKPEDRVPDKEIAYIGIVSGCTGSVEFDHALEIVSMDEYGEWYIHGHFDAENVVVHYWADVDLPKEVEQHFSVYGNR